MIDDPTLPHRDVACSEGGFRTTDVDLLEWATWIYEPKARLQHERPGLVGTAMAIRTPTHTSDVISWDKHPRRPEIPHGSRAAATS